MSNADEIMKYKKLLEEGIITAEEFETKKKQLLNEEDDVESKKLKDEIEKNKEEISDLKRKKEYIEEQKKDLKKLQEEKIVFLVLFIASLIGLIYDISKINEEIPSAVFNPTTAGLLFVITLVFAYFYDKTFKKIKEIKKDIAG